MELSNLKTLHVDTTIGKKVSLRIRAIWWAQPNEFLPRRNVSINCALPSITKCIEENSWSFRKIISRLTRLRELRENVLPWTCYLARTRLRDTGTIDQPGATTSNYLSSCNGIKIKSWIRKVATLGTHHNDGEKRVFLRTYTAEEKKKRNVEETIYSNLHG